MNSIRFDVLPNAQRLAMVDTKGLNLLLRSSSNRVTSGEVVLKYTVAITDQRTGKTLVFNDVKIDQEKPEVPIQAMVDVVSRLFE